MTASDDRDNRSCIGCVEPYDPGDVGDNTLGLFFVSTRRLQMTMKYYLILVLAMSSLLKLSYRSNCCRVRSMAYTGWRFDGA